MYTLRASSFFLSTPPPLFEKFAPKKRDSGQLIPHILFVEKDFLQRRERYIKSFFIRNVTTNKNAPKGKEKQRPLTRRTGRFGVAKETHQTRCESSQKLHKNAFCCALSAPRRGRQRFKFKRLLCVCVCVLSNERSFKSSLRL